MRLFRAFVEACVVVLGFALAILLVGLPLALVVRLVHDLVGRLS